MRRVRKTDPTREVKIRLLRVSNICALCGHPINTMHEASIDHITPLAKGGLDSPLNMQLAHRICNERKGDRNG